MFWQKREDGKEILAELEAVGKENVKGRRAEKILLIEPYGRSSR